MSKVLVIGSGGREHALAWKLSQSPRVSRVYAAPGNGGTSNNVPISSDDFDSLIRFVREQDIGLTVVGPEAPLAAGIVDEFQRNDLRIFGPSRAAAQLEASKAFAKDLMTELGIPTASYFTTDDRAEAHKFLNDHRGPVVVKASGLAAGKGVVICDNHEEARIAIDQIMVDRAFGGAGDIVVIEERLEGTEFSLLAFSDGKTVQPMVVARDHKRALDGDRGLNTGGMGAIAPDPDVSQQDITFVVQQVLEPVIEGLTRMGTPYKGVLYAGLMKTRHGIKVLEFNCRFGDPEAQAILPLLQSDLYEVLQDCIDGKLPKESLEWHPLQSATVVIAAGGYPGTYSKGDPIVGLNRLPDDTLVFHAGTRVNGGQLVTNGGRVLAVTAVEADLATAISKVYAGIEQITFQGMHYRTDIGRKGGTGS